MSDRDTALIAEIDRACAEYRATWPAKGTALERMEVLDPDRRIDTANERWWYGTENPCHWYDAGANFAVEKLGPGHYRPLLVIGSPAPEVRRLRFDCDWEVTFLDWREPPDDPGIGGYVVIGDAMAMPFDGASFDAVSSTCVMCHVGLGRYGDPVRINGDLEMMREISRVLKPGGKAAIMVGPALPNEILQESVVYGNVHRIYRWRDVGVMARLCGLECLESAMFTTHEWSGAPEVEELIGEDRIIEYCYLSVLLRKPE